MIVKSHLLSLFFLVLLPCQARSEIQPGSTLRIQIMGVPLDEKAKIDSMYPVGESGTVNLPYVGQIHAAGLSSENLSKTIESALKRGGIFDNPTIQVFSNAGEDGPQEQFVHVGGQVLKTGPVQFRKGLTLFQAVQAAGGSSEFGSLKRVQLLRDGKTQLFDLTKPENMMLPVKSEDTLIVPQKSAFGG